MALSPALPNEKTNKETQKRKIKKNKHQVVKLHWHKNKDFWIVLTGLLIPVLISLVSHQTKTCFVLKNLIGNDLIVAYRHNLKHLLIDEKSGCEKKLVAETRLIRRFFKPDELKQLIT